MRDEWRWVDAADAALVAIHGLGLAVVPEVGENGGIVLTPPVPWASACAEALRGALWALSNRGAAPVYVTRLLNAVRPTIETIMVRAAAEQAGPAVDGAGALPDAGRRPTGDARSPFLDGALNRTLQGGTGDEVTRFVRSVLDDLALIGDVATVGNGYWLPGACRLVALSDARRELLLGGVPTSELPAGVRESVQLGSLARVVRRVTGAGVEGIPRQHDDDWRQRPAGPVAAWARHIIDSIRLLEIDDPRQSFECYAPAAAAALERRTRSGGPLPSQYFRWLEPTSRLPDGRYVVRHLTATGRRFAIGELKTGRIHAIGEPVLERGDIRRLLYGVDALEQCPTCVTVKRASTVAPWRFRLTSALPGAELRLCTALGRLLLPSNGRYYPQTWEIPAGAAADVYVALRDLGVVLQDGLAKTGHARGPS